MRATRHLITNKGKGKKLGGGGGLCYVSPRKILANPVEATKRGMITNFLSTDLCPK